jgi:L-alanine-DL-glutamate epimerase-like enolase superfamily enzyme
MKIRDIDTLLIDSPGRKWTIVRVFTDEYIVGLGEATYSNKEPVVAAAVEHMKEELIGEDPSRIEYLWHKIYLNSSVSGIWRMTGPVWMSALSGIDQALWDIKGKVANLPVVEASGRQVPRPGRGIHPLRRGHARGLGSHGHATRRRGLHRPEERGSVKQ